MTEKPDTAVTPEPDPGPDPLPPDPYPPEPEPEPHPALTFDQARHRMLSEMTPEERIAFYQQDTPDQQKQVEEWHNENFGVPMLPNPKF